MAESVGQILKKARLEKKLTAKDASDATRLTSRHISAMENDSFDQFPGETYTVGFLKSYAKFLGLDPDHIVQIYKGSVIQELETPLQQLTQPAITTADYVKRYAGFLGIAVAIIAAGIIGYGLISSNTQIIAGGDNTTLDIDTHLQNSLKIPEIDTDHLNLHSGFATALVAVEKGIDFSIHNKEVYLVLDSLDYQAIDNRISRAKLFFYPGKKQIELVENSPMEIVEPGIEPFTLTLKGATPHTIKLQIEVKEGAIDKVEEENTEDMRINNPSNFIILFEGVTTGENYVEIYVDGKLQKKGLLPRGAQLYFQANDAIQMKIGDAGSIKVKINGNEHNFGKKGQQVNKIIRKVKDPVEQTRFTYIIKDT